MLEKFRTTNGQDVYIDLDMVAMVFVYEGLTKYIVLIISGYPNELSFDIEHKNKIFELLRKAGRLAE